MAKATKKSTAKSTSTAIVAPPAPPAPPSDATGGNGGGGDYSKEACTEVLNLRLPASAKSALAAEAIRDGRSISQVALRAMRIGMAQMGI